MRAPLRLSDELARVADTCRRENLTLGELIQTVEHRSHALMALIISLPFLLPMPLPGLSIPFGVILMLVGGKHALGHNPWLPKRFRNRKVPQATFIKVFTRASHFFRRFEKIVRPRGQWFQKFPAVKEVNGILVVLCGALLALPLPPGTNFPPALCVVLISVGILEFDSVVLGLGYLVFLANVVLFGSILFFGVHGVQWLSNYSEFMHKF